MAVNMFRTTGRCPPLRADRLGSADTVSMGAQGLQGESIVGDAVHILTSGFGLLPINEFGKAAQKRREAARAHLSSLGR